MARSNTTPSPRTKSAKQLETNTKKNTRRASRSSGRTTKHDRVLGLLQPKGGATIAAKEAANERGQAGGLKSTMEDAPRWGITDTLCFGKAGLLI
jgi:hypothetical protein